MGGRGSGAATIRGMEVRSYLGDEPLGDVVHRLWLARGVAGMVEELPPGEERDRRLAALRDLIAAHEAELARRDRLAAEVLAAWR